MNTPCAQISVLAIFFSSSEIELDRDEKITARIFFFSLLLSLFQRTHFALSILKSERCGEPETLNHLPWWLLTYT